MLSKIRKGYRRAIAFLLTVAMVITNLSANLTAAFAAGESERALFVLEGVELREAIRRAEEEGEVFKFSSLELKAGRKSVKNKYEKLLGGKEGKVYQLDLEIDDSYAPEGTSLEVYYNEGTEDVVFLFVNESDMVVTFYVNIDGYETTAVTVAPNTENVDDEEASYAEDYQSGTMIDDVKEKPKAEVVNSQETGADEETKAAETEEMDSEDETLAAGKEEADVKEETEETSVEEIEAEETEAETEEETEAETEEEIEIEIETEAAEEEDAEDAADGELLSISRHQAAVVAISLDELADENEEISVEEETEVETEEETEAETEEETEAETEEETEAETEEETEAEEVKIEETTSEEAAEPVEEENRGGEDEDAVKIEETKAEIEESKEEVVVKETEKENQKDEEDSSDRSGSDKEDNRVSDLEGQLLEDDSIEIRGELKGKDYKSVTIRDHANARAFQVAWEDIEEIILENPEDEEEYEALEYLVEYQVNYPEAATVKGADSVAEGEDLYFAVEAEDGYEIVAVYANGEELSEVESGSDLASASNWKGYSHVYVVEAVEEDLWIDVEMEGLEPVIAAAVYTAETTDAVFSVDVPEGAFEEEVTLRAVKIEGEMELQELTKQTNDALKEDQAVLEIVAYDVAFISRESGEEVEPSKPVAVNVKFKEAIVSSEEKENVQGISVVHLPDDANAETVAAVEDVSETEFSFRLDSFSPIIFVSKMEPKASVNGNVYPTVMKAVAAAADGDTITLLDDVTESVTVSKNVTFDLNDHTWTGDGAAALTISSKVNVEVKNGTMSAVESYNAIKATAGTLTLDKVTFTGSTTKAGGTLSLNATSRGNLTAKLTGCTFSNNVRIIYAKNAILTLEDCQITDNSNLTWANGPIAYIDNSEITFINGVIKDNTGVENKIIEVYSNSSLVMDGTELTNNSGYGVVGTGSASDITMKNVVATGNSGAGYMNSGGSVLNAHSIAGKKIILENVTAKENENTKEHGGAFYFYNTSNSNTSIEIKGCTITGNTACKQGGAIYLNNKGTTTISDTVITGNTANATPTNKTVGYGQVGGGLYVANTAGSVILKGKTHIYNNYTPNDTLIPGTSTHGSADMVLASTAVTSSTSAKNPDNFTRASLTMDEEVEAPFTDDEGNQHTLTRFERTLVNKNGYYYTSGSNYYWPMGYYTITKEPARVYLASGGHTGEDNTEATSLAEAVKAAKKKGIDKIYVCGNTTVDMASVGSLNSDITFVRCKDHPDRHMFTINGSVTLKNAHIDGQNVDSKNSLIYVPSGGNLTIGDGTVIENGKNTTGNGGAIYVSQGSLTMRGGRITKNTAKQGGGIYAMGGKLVAFEGGEVSKNIATGGNGGGGAYIEATSSEFGVNGGRTVFDGNESNQLGGGVFLVNGTNANTHHYIYKATFTNNKSYRSGYYFDGGAIYVQSGTTAHMKNVYVSGNSDSDKANNGYTAVAVCPTGKLAIYELDGLLAVNNSKNPDIGVIAGGQMPTTSPQVYLPNYAPGGGEVSYKYSGGTVVKTSDYQFVEGYFRLYTEASDSAIATAEETAKKEGVIITGNYATQYGSGIMTNGILKIGTETKSLKVVKEWKDEKNHDDDQILVYLTKDGKIVDQDFRSDSSVILNKANDWSYTWTNLGNQFKWGVKEASVHGYDSDVKVEKDREFSAIADEYYIATITNTSSDELFKKLVITKNAYGLDPDDSYEFTLKLKNVGEKVFALQMDGTLYPIYNNEIKFSLKNRQSAIVDGLPRDFDYEVVEGTGDYFTYTSESITENEIGNVVTNVHTNVEKTQVEVNKVWRDESDWDGIRPKSITVELIRKIGDSISVEDTKTLGESNGWSITFKDLPKYAMSGEEIEWKVREVAVDGYTSEITGNKEIGYTITNTHKPTVTVKGKKTWIDVEEEGSRPESIVVKLYADGVEIDSKTVTAEDNWEWRFDNLYKFEEGEKGILITYTFTEVIPEGYSVTYIPPVVSKQDTVYTGEVINTHDPYLTNRTVIKNWNDGHNEDGVRPSQITVQLKADGVNYKDPVVLTAPNWRYDWTDLEKYNDDKSEIQYEVEELETDGIKEIYILGDPVYNEEDHTFIITNTQITGRTVNKVWNDENNQDNLRPVNISVQLIADEDVVETITLNEANSWHHQWDNLPKYKNDRKIVYTVREIQVDGYTSSINEANGIITITNTHTPDRPPQNPPRRPGGGNPGGGGPRGGGDNPGGPGGTTEIDEPDVPLADFNEPEPDLIPLVEEDVPLAAFLPKTGDSRSVAVWMLVFSGASLGMLATAIGLKKKRKED